MAINHIVLLGSVSKGPEFRMTQSGIPNATLTLAVTRPGRTEGSADITDYVRVVAWRALAERVNEGITKGEMVVVEGRLTTRSYETQDGQRRKSVEVEATAINPVLSVKKAADKPSSQDEPDGPIYDDDFADLEAPAPAKAPAARKPVAAPASSADFDDDIPF